jgi:hypothetical protein
MKQARIGMLAIVALAVATVAFAQKPDFSGSWTPEPAAGAPAGAPAGGGGGGRGMMGPMTVKQSATELTIERAGREGAVMSTVYKLDGTPSKVMTGQNEGTATAKWDGNKLVITQKVGENESTQTWSLANGVLTIDRTGGRGPSTTTYKKST